jgi:hypothetical protein
MKLLRKRDIPEEKYSNAFLGFGKDQNKKKKILFSSLLHDGNS